MRRFKLHEGLDKEKLGNEIIRMKILIAKLVREKNKDFIGVLEKYFKE